MRAAGRHAFRILFNAEEELRTDKEPLQRPLDSRFESALLTSGLIKRHEHFDIFVAHRPAVRASFERGNDTARTGLFLRRRRRPAYKDAAPRGGVSRSFGVIRTAE